jgi:Sec-independent protein translocase protein TatA
MMKMLLYGLLIYFLYKVIFEIVVPVSNGVKSVRQNMEQMQAAAKKAQEQQNAQYQQQQAQANKPKVETEDAEYIDFEEVKKK